jgi:hypothetical protein
VSVVLHRREVRRDVSVGGGIALGQEQDRHAFPECLGNAAEGILHPRPILGGKHAETPASHLPAESVRCVDPAPFLTEHDGPDASRGRCFDERVGRKTGQPFHPLRLQAADNQIESVHSLFSVRDSLTLMLQSVYARESLSHQG